MEFKDKDPLQPSVAFRVGAFATMKDKVLLEMKQRSEAYMPPPTSSPIRAAQAVATRGIRSPRGTRKPPAHHKRFSSIHRRDFEKLPSIATHFSVAPRAEDKDPNGNGKREGVRKLSSEGSPTKRRRMENVSEDIRSFTFPAQAQVQVQVQVQPPPPPPPTPPPPTFNFSFSNPRTSSERSLRNVKSFRNAKSDVGNKENTSPGTHTDIRPDTRTKAVPQPERVLKSYPSNTNLKLRTVSAPARTDSRIGQARTESRIGQARTESRMESRAESRMDSRTESRIGYSTPARPAHPSITHSTSTRSIHSNQIPSRIPRSTTLKSMRSIDNFNSTASNTSYTPNTSNTSNTTTASRPPSTPTSRLLKSRLLAKSSPNLNALTKDSQSISRPAWR